MLLGYNTNGLAHHGLLDAIELLASRRYECVGITIDHHALNPSDPSWPEQLDLVAAVLRRHSMRSVIETGARFLLDPANKHEPTLVSPSAAGRETRLAFLRHAIDVAAALGSDCVSIWSGVVPPGMSHEVAWRELTVGLRSVMEYAEARQVVVALEPEPDMLVDTTDQFAELLDRFDSERLALTLDIGHLHCLDETPISERIERWATRIANVHIEDMRAGKHEHLMFGEGEIDFPPIVTALANADYRGGLFVELSGHCREAPAAVEAAAAFLRPLIAAAAPTKPPEKA